MEIYSETGFLIIMDPHYLQLGDMDTLERTDFTKQPRQAAKVLESILFPELSTGKIGLIELPDGSGTYKFDEEQVSFWDVENNQKRNRTIFGVEFSSYVLFDIKHIQSIFNRFNLTRFESKGEAAHLKEIDDKIDAQKSNIIWRRSQVGIGDGWHEISSQAFSKTQS